jgi:hypothetical protein
MIILQNHDIFDEMAELDIDTGAISFYSKKNNPEKSSLSLISGSYAKTEQGLFCFYNVDQNLFFMANETVVSIDDETFGQIYANGPRYVFELIRNNEILFKIEYAPPVIDPPLEECWLFGFEGKENFDFFLFFRNILKDPERRSLMKGIDLEEDEMDGIEPEKKNKSIFGRLWDKIRNKE